METAGWTVRSLGQDFGCRERGQAQPLSQAVSASVCLCHLTLPLQVRKLLLLSVTLEGPCPPSMRQPQNICSTTKATSVWKEQFEYVNIRESIYCVAFKYLEVWSNLHMELGGHERSCNKVSSKTLFQLLLIICIYIYIKQMRQKSIHILASLGHRH